MCFGDEIKALVGLKFTGELEIVEQGDTRDAETRSVSTCSDSLFQFNGCSQS